MAKKKEYVELPSKRKLTIMVVLSLALYAVALLTGKLLFPELSAETRLLLSRMGTVFLFMAGLLAGVGFYWNSLAQHNADLATTEMAKAEKDIASLSSVKADLGDKFTQQIEANEQRLRFAKSRLSEARQFPAWIDYAGCLSMLILTVGTLLILFGLA
ncbi:hypothetical protein [Pseudomonas faucium]|uniref:hypothetical protein n=1 Tax=Pseudomonas faucium TaxID=2740518 RepID=UPI0039C05F6B